MNKLIFNIVFSLILFPVNFGCAFWIFREALNLTGMTFKEFLSATSEAVLPNQRKRQIFLVRFFNEKSSDPKKSVKLLWTYGICTLPGLAALMLAGYAEISSNPNKLKYAFIGNLILVFVNIGLAFAGRVYRKNYPIDERNMELLEDKRIKEKEERKKQTKNIIVYTLIGVFFFAVLLFFNLGIASILKEHSGNTGREDTRIVNISRENVNVVLLEKGYETANIPTTYWRYDENKLANVCAGIKDDAKFEFYEYTDGDTTDLVYNQIVYNITPDTEPNKRDGHETVLPGRNKMFTVIIDGVYYLVMYKNNTVIYAHSPESLDEINDILVEIGYLKNKQI